MASVTRMQNFDRVGSRRRCSRRKAHSQFVAMSQRAETHGEGRAVVKVSRAALLAAVKGIKVQIRRGIGGWNRETESTVGH